ncbi:penicillin-binding protein 2 [Kineosporia sp. J2-2]|uniref:Penicillin-binding protein 2 n=1 Tax=Kineosporia corallincola TaxID=2835133 RepID=A0ABS5TJ15_9ACTN|nr:penicillin-binding protein 2 [Kineosporia corallincola]MBT0771080.1 penicillin-binding protein 2 [Kineosporia corallincola]
MGPPRAGQPDLRLKWVSGVVVLVFVVFAGRLVQLQAFDAETLSAEALESRSATRTLPAHRGDILDTDGSVLATTVERRNITVDQTVVSEYNSKAAVPEDEKGAAGAAKKIAPILGESVGDVARTLAGNKRFNYVAKSVEPTVWSDISDLNIPGVYSEQASRRTYPADSVASNVLGFMNGEGEAVSGIEKSQDDLLSGTDGEMTYEKGKNGQQIATGLTTETDPVDGKDVQLTLDRDLQYKSQEALEAVVKKYDAESATLVALNPKSGEILALADAPGYNSNKPGDSDVANLRNRTLTDVFEPGSTNKVITAAAALEEGVVQPTSKLEVPYTLDRGAAGVISDSHEHATERLTFAGVLAQSSNTGTVEVGEKMSAKTMYEYLTRFGLGSKTGVGLGESSGILAGYQDWDGRTRLNVMFGQGVSVTALQSAEVFAAIANDGVRVAPKLIKAVSGADGKLVAEPEGKKTRVVSAKTAQQVRLMLESVVGEDGTAVDAEIKGYRVAGKTGTAQAYDEDCGCYSGYTASFVGMAPADDPELVVAVFVQKPEGDHYGGTVAAPVFQQIMSDALVSQGIEPTNTRKPDLALEW